MIEKFVFNHFQENTYILYDQTKECVVIDPGCNEKEEKERLFSFISNRTLHLQKVLLTHAHIDHFCGVVDICSKYDVPLIMHKDGARLLGTAAVQSKTMNFQSVDVTDIEIQYAEYNSQIIFGDNYILKTLNVSGHCGGSIAYYSRSDESVFVGDAIFYQSIGRTDLFGGDLDELVTNIKNNIMTLPSNTRILPGHGPTTYIDFEKSNNPYI